MPTWDPAFPKRRPTSSRRTFRKGPWGSRGDPCCPGRRTVFKRANLLLLHKTNTHWTLVPSQSYAPPVMQTKISPDCSRTKKTRENGKRTHVFHPCQTETHGKRAVRNTSTGTLSGPTGSRKRAGDINAAREIPPARQPKTWLNLSDLWTETVTQIQAAVAHWKPSPRPFETAGHLPLEMRDTGRQTPLSLRRVCRTRYLGSSLNQVNRETSSSLNATDQIIQTGAYPRFGSSLVVSGEEGSGYIPPNPNTAHPASTPPERREPHRPHT